MKVKSLCKFASVVLTAAFCFSLAPAMIGRESVSAAGEKNKGNTCLGTSGIASPLAPASLDSEWSGSYVYFGNYDGTPVKFRVLAPETTVFGSSTIFLDSDAILYNDFFDSDRVPNKPSFKASDWAYSDVIMGLNGDKFLYKYGVFTPMERDAIAESKNKAHALVDSDVEETGKVDPGNRYVFENYVALTGEKIFLLDIEDVSNISYGYSMINKISANRVKKYGDSAGIWWLRSRASSIEAGVVQDGCPIKFLTDYYDGVAPALNIDLSSVIFSSIISGSFNTVGTEYKLTLKDKDISVALPTGSEVTVEEDTVMVPYKITGVDRENATRLSCLITDKEYSDSEAKIIYYDEMGGTFSWGSTGTFKLPSNLNYWDWGSKYHVYILAEDINKGKNTDYASEPYEIRPKELEEHIINVETDENVMATANPVKGIEGTKVTLNAFLKDGYQFKEWQVISGGVTLADKKKATTTFTIGTQDVVIKAVSEKKQKPEPTAVPTAKPTAKPIANPTAKPTGNPTTAPAEPTAAPAAVNLTLDKATAQIKCGGSGTLKATLSGSSDKITWKSSDTKIATVDANGKVTTKQAGTVTITASASGKSAACVVTVLYKDVTNIKDFWYASTNYLTAKGVVKGYDKQTKFKPANECTRAQMVTFIWRLMGEPEPKTKTCKFSDVKTKDYFYKACLWGNENHIVEGYKDGTFGPKIVCARRHAVTFLWRLAGQPAPKTKTNKFKDVKEKDYFYKATLWASENKILAGYKDGTFKPNGDCLRRQMVTFLYKYDKFVNGKG